MVAFENNIIFAYLDFTKMFIFDCDACGFGINGVLLLTVRLRVKQPVVFQPQVVKAGTHIRNYL